MPRLLSPSVVRELGYYVYLYVDPRDDSVFYVGKGTGNRLLAHLEDEGPSARTTRIAEILAAGRKPRIEVLVHGLADEDTALKIEAAVIDLLGTERLTNENRGYQARSHGRMTVDQITALYGAATVEITEPSLLIRINRFYRHTMAASELYDATRGFWKIGPDRDKAKLAMAVYEGVIREVYEVERWVPAGTTLEARFEGEVIEQTRWEFVGHLASDPVRLRYVHGSVAHYLSKASQNPILYLNI